MLRKNTWDKVTDRMLLEAHPYLRTKAQMGVQQLEDKEIFVRIYCVYRSPEEQARKYAIGRDENGNEIGTIVTRAKPWQSFHNYSLAFDCVEIRRGKAIWNNTKERWETIAGVFKALGLEWAGEWMNFKESPHFQATNGYKWQDLKALHDAHKYDRDGFLILKKMYI